MEVCLGLGGSVYWVCLGVLIFADLVLRGIMETLLIAWHPSVLYMCDNHALCGVWRCIHCVVSCE